MSKIKQIRGREILDSRANPTVEATVILENGGCGTAAVPSGASTGAFEAVELRDGDKERYNGKGVKTAVAHVNEDIATLLTGKDGYCQERADEAMQVLDGTENKSRLGANAILAVSLALAKAEADGLKMPLYRYVGGLNGRKMPLPMMNILNGGRHAGNNLDVQEFMILPVGAERFCVGLRRCCEVYHALASILEEKGLSTGIGDEGGFAPDLNSEEEAIELILAAIERAGYTAGEGKDFMISLDVAASEWKEEKKSSGQFSYRLPKKGEVFTSEGLMEHWDTLTKKYPIYSLEDPLDEEDWDGWRMLTQRIGNRVMLVGDDLFVTNPKRLRYGIKNEAANAILIKPNQIGSLSETMEAIRIATENGYRAIMSHRSGETEDTTIADLAVGLNTGFIKTGAPCRGERTAKYNRLLQIEAELRGGK
ncbi:MAG: phosphopyruvate hydratase [Lachnospiraceae bacterium]|nr:phosphopyruvate hydratase [Lachnospiraceae bacterium]